MNAIILAAGMGQRLLPFTLSRPKPLTIINSQPIIERQILLLKEAGITEVYIVVGYLADAYLYLKKKFGVRLIYNPRYRDINNIYSLFLAKDFLSNTLVIEGDLFLTRNIFQTSFDRSFYFTGIKMDFMEEWILDFNAENRLIDVIKPKELKSAGIYEKAGAYVLTGISYWEEEACKAIRYYLEKEVHSIFKDPESVSKTFYWDEIIRTNLDKLAVYVKKISKNDWFEIDSESDLRSLNNFLACVC